MKRRNVVFYNTKAKKKKEGVQKEVFVLCDLVHIVLYYPKWHHDRTESILVETRLLSRNVIREMN